MAVPTVLADLSSTIASNSPAGGDAVGTTLDDYLRAHAGLLAQAYAASLLKANNLSDVASASTSRTNLGLANGTYTPTLGNTTNVASSTAYTCQYLQIGTVVTVSGKVDITPTAGAATATLLRISLPVASVIASDTQVGGVATCGGVASLSASISGDATPAAAVRFISGETTARSWFFTFTYLVV